MSRVGWDFGEAGFEVVEGVEKGKGRGWWTVHKDNDGRLVGEDWSFGEEGRRGWEKDLLMGFTWRLISWLMV